jgi:superfamily II RNA helicase
LCIEKLQEAREHLVAIATSLANVQIEYGMPIVVKDYVKTVNPAMMEVVYEWARGMVCLYFQLEIHIENSHFPIFVKLRMCRKVP